MTPEVFSRSLPHSLYAETQTDKEKIMTALQNKIDFAALFTVDHANPNGDPLSGNRPREDYDGYGEVTDVCIKRKLRNRLADLGENVFVISQDNASDGFNSLRERADACEALKQAKKAKDREAFVAAACDEWIDVRSFGQLFAYSGASKKDGTGVSVGIRGPVSVHSAFSVDPIVIEDVQITKSVNSETATNESGDSKKSSDTMGMKYRVPFGLYLIKGSINCQLAEKTGFSEADAEKIKQALCTLFENDASSARPEGSIEMRKVYWWRHNCKAGQYSTAQVHRSLQVTHMPGVEEPKRFEDYDVKVIELKGLEVEEIPSA